MQCMVFFYARGYRVNKKIWIKKFLAIFTRYYLLTIKILSHGNCKKSCKKSCEESCS